MKSDPSITGMAFLIIQSLSALSLSALLSENGRDIQIQAGPKYP